LKKRADKKTTSAIHIFKEYLNSQSYCDTACMKGGDFNCVTIFINELRDLYNCERSEAIQIKITNFSFNHYDSESLEMLKGCLKNEFLK